MKRTVIFSSVCAALALLLLVWGFSTQGTVPAGIRIMGALLLVEDDTGTYLMQLRKGLQEAVQARGGTLSVERLSDFDPGRPAAAYDGYNAIYLLSDSPGDYLPALHERGLPVIVLGKEVRGESCVLPDEQEGGRGMGSYLNGILPGGHLLIISGEPQDSREELRINGLADGLGNLPYTRLDPETLKKTRTEWASAILALSDGALDAAMKLQGESGLPVFAFDAVDTRVELMEAGRLSAVSADNPYALGYLAGGLLDEIDYRGLSPTMRLSPRQVVTRQNMYDAANVKLIFPLLH